MSMDSFALTEVYKDHSKRAAYTIYLINCDSIETFKQSITIVFSLN